AVSRLVDDPVELDVVPGLAALREVPLAGREVRAGVVRVVLRVLHRARFEGVGDRHGPQDLAVRLAHDSPFVVAEERDGDRGRVLPRAYQHTVCRVVGDLRVDAGVDAGRLPPHRVARDVKRGGRMLAVDVPAPEDRVVERRRELADAAAVVLTEAV